MTSRPPRGIGIASVALRSGKFSDQALRGCGRRGTVKANGFGRFTGNFRASKRWILVDSLAPANYDDQKVAGEAAKAVCLDSARERYAGTAACFIFPVVAGAT